MNDEQSTKYLLSHDEEEKEEGPNPSAIINQNVTCTPGWLRVTELNKNDYIGREYYVPRRDDNHELKTRDDGLFNCMILINATPGNFDDETNGPFFVENSNAVVKGVKNVARAVKTGAINLASAAAEQHGKNVDNMARMATDASIGLKSAREQISTTASNISDSAVGAVSAIPGAVNKIGDDINEKIDKTRRRGPEDERKELVGDITTEQSDLATRLAGTQSELATRLATKRAEAQAEAQAKVAPSIKEKTAMIEKILLAPRNSGLLNYVEANVPTTTPTKKTYNGDALGKPIVKVVGGRPRYMGTLKGYTDSNGTRTWTFLKDGIEHVESSRVKTPEPKYFPINTDSVTGITIDESKRATGGQTRRYRSHVRHNTRKRIARKTRRVVVKGRRATRRH